MKKTIKFVSLVLALVMCLSVMPMSAFAAAFCNECMVNDMTAPDGLCDECRNQQNATPDGENKVDVSLTVGETWTVKIPKTLVLDAASKSVDYEVQVSGNIAGTKQVKVAPDASFLMKQDGKDDITAEITQTKQAVASDEIEDGTVVEISGSIAAPDATSGTWNGSFNFNIALEEAVKLISFTIGGTPYQAEEGMTWAQWIESDYNSSDCTNMEGHYIDSDSHPGMLLHYNGNLVDVNSVITTGDYIFEV